MTICEKERCWLCVVKRLRMAGQKDEKSFVSYNITEKLNQELLRPFICEITALVSDCSDFQTKVICYLKLKD